MGMLLWILQIFLAITFLFSGICKATMPEQWLVTHGQTGVAGLPAGLIKFIGTIEIIGALGLVLPWWLRVAPILTPLSAIGFCIVMVLAARQHYRLGEYRTIAINAGLVLVSAFVAYGRILDVD